MSLHLTLAKVKWPNNNWPARPRLGPGLRNGDVAIDFPFTATFNKRILEYQWLTIKLEKKCLTDDGNVDRIAARAPGLWPGAWGGRRVADFSSPMSLLGI